VQNKLLHIWITALNARVTGLIMNVWKKNGGSCRQGGRTILEHRVIVTHTLDVALVTKKTMPQFYWN
jgi:hypothetical protein